MNTWDVVVTVALFSGLVVATGWALWAVLIRRVGEFHDGGGL